MKLKKGDTVYIISGKDKGKTGKITRALPADGKIIVEGVNIKKRHQKPRRERQKGQIVEFASPVDVSNAMIVDPKTQKPTRIGTRMENKKKVRIAKKSNTVV
jgi:large subunit ribosomal protein L24